LQVLFSGGATLLALRLPARRTCSFSRRGYLDFSLKEG